MIDWYARVRRRQTLIGVASVVFRRVGKAKVKLKLTRKGIKLLDRRKRQDHHQSQLYLHGRRLGQQHESHDAHTLTSERLCLLRA